MPRVGFSNRRGFVYEQPFYWAIDKSSDLTLTADIETEARIGLIGEYRYAWSKNSRGAFTGGIFNESIGGGEEPITSITREPTSEPVNRWIVAGRHRTMFDGGQLYLDVLRISDDNFLREIRAFASNVSSDIQIRSQRFTAVTARVVDTWQGGGVQAEATSYQDLIDPQRFALDRLPRVAVEHSIPVPRRARRRSPARGRRRFPAPGGIRRAAVRCGSGAVRAVPFEPLLVRFGAGDGPREPHTN
jgi:LPS-assembly protein